MEATHEPVMLQEVLELASNAFKNYSIHGSHRVFTVLDGTLGAGGHSLELARAYLQASFFLCDRDEQMVARARANFKASGFNPDDARFRWICSRSSQLGQRLDSEFDNQEGGLDFALLDLGISMLHLKEFDRGFSYDDESLDMRLDTATEKGASHLLNELPEKELADLIYRYGEERASRKIAHRVVQSRPIESARQLAEIIAKAIPGPRNRPHPARKTFQALRISVNGELEEAEAAARMLAQRLNPGGILAIITFHSLEDRLIKRCFAELCGAGGLHSRYDAPVEIPPDPEFEKALRKSLAPTPEEQERNPASRSARLRAIRRKPSGEAGDE